MSRRAEYVRSRHGIDPAWADDAVRDDHAVWLTPDPASRSGHSVRVIGYSASASTVLAVILVEENVDPSERAEGDWWGTNAWAANEGISTGKRTDEQDKRPASRRRGGC